MTKFDKTIIVFTCTGDPYTLKNAEVGASLDKPIPACSRLIKLFKEGDAVASGKEHITSKPDGWTQALLEQVQDRKSRCLKSLSDYRKSLSVIHDQNDQVCTTKEV